MAYDLNPISWNWNQYKAAGKHVASYAAGGVTVAVALHFLSDSQGADLGTNINLVVDGAGKVATGIAGIFGVLWPIYNALRAAHNASPTMLASSLAKEVPNTIIVTAPEIAKATPNLPNVVANTEAKVVQK